MQCKKKGNVEYWLRNSTINFSAPNTDIIAIWMTFTFLYSKCEQNIDY